MLALQSEVSEADVFFAFPVLRNPDTQGHIMLQYEGINFYHMQKFKKAITMYGPHLPFTKVLLNSIISSIGNFIPHDWRTLIKALLKPGEYLQWMMWFHDIAREHANRNAQAGMTQDQITFEMLNSTGQFDDIEVQIQCPPLLHKQLKTVALEAWDQITPQGEPTGSSTKILQGPNETYADFLGRLQTAISHTVIGEEAKRQLEKLLAYENVNQECQKAIAQFVRQGLLLII